LARRYHSNLASVEGIRLPITLEDVRHAWHLYPIRVLEGRRRHVFDFLRSKGIGVQVHYLPVHLHPVFSDMGYEKGSCPVAEQAYDELISLPLFPDLTDDLQDRVMEELRAGLRV
jgi:perosamine synthetase